MRNATRAAAAAASQSERAARTGPSSPGHRSSPCLPDTGFLRQHQVLIFVPISKSTLWRRVQARAFPAPVKLSAHVTAWRAEDVRRWIQEQGR